MRHTEVFKSSVGNKKGWAFKVWWGCTTHPNFVSALYRTKKETKKMLAHYLDAGKFELYGSAER